MQALIKVLALGATAAVGVQAQSIHEINGKAFLSPYNNQNVSNVAGVVVAKSATGLYLRSPTIARDPRVGNGLYVYDTALGKNASIAVGDALVLSGTVVEYRSSSAYLYATELTAPVVQRWTPSKNGKTPKPRVIGVDTLAPPTRQFTSLDNGDIFGVPNNVSQVSVANPTLQPDKYGLDFWKTLHGDLVTIRRPVAVAKPNKYAETWMVGSSWPTSGKNSRGGLTLSKGDANPEAILVDSPIDGSKANDTDAYVISDTFADITGVVRYQFGFYYLIPLAAPVKVASPVPALPPPTTLISTGTGACGGITVGDYNVENMMPTDTAHIARVAAHIVDYMKTPDLLFVQEIQDNSGATNDGTVDANATLHALAAAIAARPGGLQYAYTWVNPEDGKDGGQPGGNIRQAYLYNAAAVSLYKGGGARAGGPTDANAVLTNSDGKPTLKYNPGRIDPANAAWSASRKPLAAEWTTADGHVFFTVNVHWSSKGGSSSLQGDLRPPVNKPVDERVQQATVTARFIAQILAVDADARVIMAGDLNEYSAVQPVETFANVSGMIDLDVAAAIPVEERYTYTYDMDMEELDHMFVSPAIAAAARQPREEHLHVNTWVSYDDQVSDHDPTVAQLDLCGANVASNATVSGGLGYSSSTASATTLVTVTTKAATTAVATTTTTATTATTPTATAGALSGKGKLSVVTANATTTTTDGGLISAGTWYRAGGTLATYTAAANADGTTFTLSTSKGACAILASTAALSCASTVTTPSTFGFDGTYLTYAGASVFYATAVPTGSTQGTVYASAQAVSLQLTWAYV